VDSVVPSSTTHPANAAILIEGQTLDGYALVATIDDEPAILRRDERLSRYSPADDAYYVIALRLEPVPAPGQIVTVSGNACIYDADESCEQFSLVYTATEPDDVPPPPPEAWWWDGYVDVFAFEGNVDDYVAASCSGLPQRGSINVSANLGASAKAAKTEALFLHASARRRSGAKDEFQDFVQIAEPTEHVHFELDANQVGENSTTIEYCVQVELLDLAGNSSGLEEMCAPCSITRTTDSETLRCYPDNGFCGSSVDVAEKEAVCFEEPPEAGIMGDAGPASANARDAATAEPADERTPKPSRAAQGEDGDDYDSTRCGFTAGVQRQRISNGDSRWAWPRSHTDDGRGERRGSIQAAPSDFATTAHAEAERFAALRRQESLCLSHSRSRDGSPARHRRLAPLSLHVWRPSQAPHPTRGRPL
jgi:hypothetical protein